MSLTIRVKIIRVTSERIRKLKRVIRNTLNKGFVQARTLARIAGQCVSMCKCIFPAKLLLRNIYRLLKTRTAWADNLKLDTCSRADLEWWLKSVDQWNGKVIKPEKIDFQLTTDASMSGWGGWLNNSEKTNRLRRKYKAKCQIKSKIININRLTIFVTVIKHLSIIING